LAGEEVKILARIKNLAVSPGFPVHYEHDGPGMSDLRQCLYMEGTLNVADVEIIYDETPAKKP